MKSDLRPNLLGVPQSNVLDLRAYRPPKPEITTPVVQTRPKEPKLKGKPFVLPKLSLPKVRMPSFRIRPLWLSLGGFVIIALVLISPILAGPLLSKMTRIKGEVLAASTEAYGQLQTATEFASAYKFNDADNAFSQALASFEEAEKSMDGIDSTLRTILRYMPFTGGQLRTAEGLLNAGTAISKAGKLFSETVGLLSQTSVDSGDKAAGTSITLTVDLMQRNVGRIAEQVSIATDALQTVETGQVPAQYRDRLRTIKDKLPELNVLLMRTQQMVDILGSLLGSQEEKQYLLIFQNTNELRSTGGFMGSLALVAVQNGTVRVVEVPGRGFLDLNYADMPIKLAPEPLWLINTQWQIQDANWWPDFPTSAEMIRLMYESARGYPVDGVIMMTPRLVEDLLRHTGPIDLPDYDRTVDAVSFKRDLQEAVEQTYDRQLNQPKQIIGALLPRILEKIFSTSADQMLPVANTLAMALQRRDLLINAKDRTAQDNLVGLGWAGELKSAPSDYLMVVDSNIGGGKTDGVISEFIDHDVTVADDGRLTVTVNIKREHHGDPNDQWTNKTNLVYTRVYVPLGSQLVRATGFSVVAPERRLTLDLSATVDSMLERIEGSIKIDQESGTSIGRQFGKTVFGNWIEVPVNESREASITYTLPIVFQGKTPSYSLFAQAQPGVTHRRLTSKFKFPDDYEPTWTSPADPSIYQLGQTITYTTDQTSDRMYGLLFMRK